MCDRVAFIGTVQREGVQLDGDILLLSGPNQTDC